MIAVRESGISQKAVIANFLRLFPRKFEVTIAPVGGVSTVRVAFKKKKAARISASGSLLRTPAMDTGVQQYVESALPRSSHAGLPGAII